MKLSQSVPAFYKKMWYAIVIMKRQPESVFQDFGRFPAVSFSIRHREEYVYGKSP